MKMTVLKCDNCNEKHEDILLPFGWYALEKGQELRDQQSKKHFCSLECLINWTSLQTVDSRKLDIEGPISDRVEQPLTSQLYRRNNMVSGE